MPTACPVASRRSSNCSGCGVLPCRAIVVHHPLAGGSQWRVLQRQQRAAGCWQTPLVCCLLAWSRRDQVAVDCCSHGLPCVGNAWLPRATGAAAEAASCRCCCTLLCSPIRVGAGSPPCLWCCHSSSMYAVTAPAAMPRQRTAARRTLGCLLQCPFCRNVLCHNLLAGGQTRRQAANSKATRQACR